MADSGCRVETNRTFIQLKINKKIITIMRQSEEEIYNASP